MKKAVRTKARLSGLILAAMLVLSFGAGGCVKKPVAPEGDVLAEPQVTYIYHKVKYPGETLGAVSAWYTGSVNNWRVILAHNPGLDVRRIRIGDVILIPQDLVVKETPMPERFVEGMLRRRQPDAPEEAAQPRTPVVEEKKPAPVMSAKELPLEKLAKPAVEATVGKTLETSAVETPGVKVSPAPQAAVATAAPAAPVVSTPQQKLKTREELLKELLEE